MHSDISVMYRDTRILFLPVKETIMVEVMGLRRRIVRKLIRLPRGQSRRAYVVIEQQLDNGKVVKSHVVCGPFNSREDAVRAIYSY